MEEEGRWKISPKTRGRNSPMNRSRNTSCDFLLVRSMGSPGGEAQVGCTLRPLLLWEGRPSSQRALVASPSPSHPPPTPSTCLKSQVVDCAYVLGGADGTPQGRISRSCDWCLGQGAWGACCTCGCPPPLPAFIPKALMGPPTGLQLSSQPDCGSKYQLCVQLLSSAHAPLGTFQPQTQQ